MLISRNKSFLFIHNPKAGGSAIRAALAPYAEEPDRYWHQGYLQKMDRVVDLAHLDDQERRSISVDTAMNFRFSFMIIREPIQRFLSGFAEHCRQHDRNLDVNAFIASEATYGNFNHDWRYVHMKPQWKFIEPYTHMYPHEELSESWPQICAKAIGDVVPLTVTRPDDGRKPKYSDLTQTSLTRLVRLYARDYSWLLDYYKIPVSLQSDGSHYENVNFIHNPLLTPFLDATLLNAGETKGYDKVMKVRNGNSA